MTVSTTSPIRMVSVPLIFRLCISPRSLLALSRIEIVEDPSKRFLIMLNPGVSKLIIGVSRKLQIKFLYSCAIMCVTNNSICRLMQFSNIKVSLGFAIFAQKGKCVIIFFRHQAFDKFFIDWPYRSALTGHFQLANWYFVYAICNE